MTQYQTHDNDALALARARELSKATIAVANKKFIKVAHFTDGEMGDPFEVDEVRVNGMPCNQIITTEGHVEPTNGVLKI